MSICSSRPRIYHSRFPPIPTCDTSVWTHLFRDNNIYPPSAIAFIDARTGHKITRGVLKELTLELAYGLRNSVTLPGSSDSKSGENLRRGDVIMIFAPNSLSWPVMLFGAVAAGLRLTLAPGASTPLELSWQWKDSRARIIVVAPSLYRVALEMFVNVLGLSRREAEQRIWVMDRLWEYGAGNETIMKGGWNQVRSLLGLGRLDQEEKFEGADADETVYICYSSGTTGKPKGVESTHRGSGSVFSMAWEVFGSIGHKDDVSLALLPFYHIFGLIAHLHHPFYLGIPTVILPPSPAGFDGNAFLSAIETYRITTVMIAPPILHLLTTHPALENYNLMSLRTLISGAAPLPPALANAAISNLNLQGANVKILNGYGATETTLTVTIVPPEGCERKVGSVGLLVPNLQARLVKEVTDQGEVVDAEKGEPGEMWVRGPTIMKGYLHNSDATAEAFHEDWYKTGDILQVDEDGYFWVVDRKKELIKYKGMQVAPAELEALLLEHPSVLDAGVIGIPDLAFPGNELPRAYIVPCDTSHSGPKRGVVLSTRTAPAELAAEIQHWLSQRVARHKHLRGGVVLVDAIPKSPTGKILRRELREKANRELWAVAASVMAKL